MTPDLAQTITPFFDPAAIVIVAGGTLLAVVLRTPVADLVRTVGSLATLGRRRFDATPLIAQTRALGRIARRSGVMALDRSIIADADIATAVAAIVDGATPDEVAALLAEQRRARTDRHLAVIEAWAAAAEIAPAMGMVGTLVGLVAMFARMQDPGAIGAAMAVALLATLYGALIGNLVASPIAARLRRAARAEAGERLRLEAPLIALAAREQPRGGATLALAGVG